MKALKLLVVGLLLVLVAVPMAGAQGTWDSSFNVVNLGSAEAQQVDVTFYPEGGGAAYHPTTLYTSAGNLTNPFALAAGASVEVLPFLDAAMPAGKYSVVISADQPIAAIANLTNWIAQGGQPYFNGSYSGAENEGIDTLYMPAIVSDYYGWGSALSIQNLTADPVGMHVDFYTENSASVCTTLDTTTDITGFAAWNPDLPDLSACDTNADGYNGSAVITADAPIAAVDNQTSPIDIGYGLPGRTQTYNGFTGGEPTLYAPALYYRYYGWDSSINVQNIGSAATAVTVTYSDGATASQTIPANGSYLFYQFTEAGHTALTKFGATIESDGQPLVAVVNAATNQEPVGGYAPGNQAQSYSAVSAGSSTVGFPLIMREYYGWYTSYTVQNVGGAAVNLLVSYSGIATCQNLPVTGVPAGGNVEIYQGTLVGGSEICPDLPGADAPGDPNLGGYRGAVTVVVDGTGEIIGIANQTNFANRDNALNTGDWSQSYNGLPGD